ncbi:MAG: hypothetical protein QOH35_2865 [Acidobacteriaceae bacterium]|jgi:hypothetical protein|nr:hypothetical protein [Acidobacteriaceae bacterium]MEA2260337.1 hypothetical protein [Acidobacteriaceae bacterium]MEA2541499.1 hypothetical protein [Acidobacteriaceae bacterium]MEA3006197.1 hypothetical protein [Acidobacteriaceae bacterium]
MYQLLNRPRPGGCSRGTCAGAIEQPEGVDLPDDSSAAPLIRMLPGSSKLTVVDSAEDNLKIGRVGSWKVVCLL